jgi:two-component system chemotaxis response regulator CheY
MRLIVGRTLRELGFEVTEAANGQEALECLAREPEVNLVLCDWNMPVMNGLEFLQAVRADSKYAATQVVMVTTETETDQMVRALEAGANEYVMKPFTREVLEEKLRMLGVVH